VGLFNWNIAKYKKSESFHNLYAPFIIPILFRNIFISVLMQAFIAPITFASRIIS